MVKEKGYNIQSNSLIKNEVTAKSVASDEILIPMNTTFNFLCACRYMDQGHTIQKQYSDDSTQQDFKELRKQKAHQSCQISCGKC